MKKLNIILVLITIWMIFSLISVIAISQNLVVLNGAYGVLNGGTSGTPIYIVINQSNPVGIIRPGGGHISSEGQYNFVKWNAWTSTGNYVFPFGVGGNASDYIPFTFNKTTAGSADISMSTWTSNSSNVPWAAVSTVPAVTNMNITGTIDLSISSVIDRWWDIQSPSPVTADLTFSYRGIENTTAVPLDTFKAQHWNGTVWDSQAGMGNLGVTTGTGTVGPITGQTTFSPWILTRSGFSAVITSFQNSACSPCTGTATITPIGGTSPYLYSWNTIPMQTTQTATGLCAGTYSIMVTDAANNTSIDTVTITQPTVTAMATATVINIMPGDSTQLTATGGGTYSWSPAIGLNCTTCSSPTATPLQTTAYCVVVTDSNGCKDSACITINVELPCGALYIPNAFSPNNDMENDMECVMGNCIESFHFTIYNRWGEKMFETTDQKKCWDGMYKGKLMNAQVLVYYMEATLTNGEKIIKKGNISLLR